MSNKVDFKTIVFLFPGAFLFFAHIMLYRELIARNESPLLISALFLFFVSLWTGAGALFSPFRSFRHKPASWNFHFLLSLILLPPAGLTSIALVNLLGTISRFRPLETAVIASAISSIPIGLSAGYLLFCMRLSPHFQIRESGRIFFGFGYLIAGIGVYPFMISRLNSYSALLAAFGAVIILGACLNILKYFKKATAKIAIFLLATSALMLNILLLPGMNRIQKAYWQEKYPSWQLIKEFDINSGRISLLSRTTSQLVPNNLILLKNGKKKLNIPDDCARYIAGILPASLQPDKLNLNCLVIGTPFSLVPSMLNQLPHVASVSFVHPSRKLTALAALYRILPLSSDKFIASTQPIEFFLSNDENKYDLIFFMDSESRRRNTLEILRLSLPRLSEKGALIVTYKILADLKEQIELDSIFGKVVKLPGNSGLYALGGNHLTEDIFELESRLDSFKDNPVPFMPKGTFSILYSIPGSSRGFTPFSPSILKIVKKEMTTLPLSHLAWILAGALIYYIFRFVLSRKNDLHMVAGLLENGTCLTGALVIMLALMQFRGFPVFFEAGTLFATFGCVTLGVSMSDLKLFRRTIPFFTILSTGLLFLFSWEDFDYIIPAIASLSALSCGGIAGYIHNFIPHSEKDPKRVAADYFGYAAGALLFALLISLHCSIYICIFVIILLRVPLFFSKLVIGNKN
jgi:hypothetical protein